VLITAAIILAISGAFLWQQYTHPSDGARMLPGGRNFHPQGVVVTPIENVPSDLQAGDLVLGVEGQDLNSWAGNIKPFRPHHPAWQPGGTLTYTIERKGNIQQFEIDLIRYPLERIIAQEWGAVTFAVVNFLVAGFIFYRRPEQRAAQVVFLIGASVLGATTWSLGLDVIDLIHGWGWWYFVLTTLAAFTLVWIGILHLALIFPRRQPVLEQHSWIIPIIYILPYLVILTNIGLSRMSSPTLLAWMGTWDSPVTYLESGYTLLILASTVNGYRAIPDHAALQQSRWVMFALLTVIGFAFTFALFPQMILDSPLVSWNVVALVGLLIPISLAFAILRYRLFEIDIIINRALVYGSMTSLVVGTYIVIVGLIGSRLQSRAELWLSLLATGLVAVLFQPLKDRLQKLVNHWMYGDRDDPYAVITALGKRLENVISPDNILSTIVESIAQALKLSYVGIALREGERYAMQASYGLPPPALLDARQEDFPFSIEGHENGHNGTVVIPLSHHHDLTGALVLSQAADDGPFSSQEKTLLQDLARQVEIAVRNLQLTLDLRQSRKQLVTAREEERQRIYRDLHDGLGSALASQGLKLGTAHGKLAKDPAGTRRLLEDLMAQNETIIADIRRLVHELRPPAVDELGLAGALRDLIRTASPANSGKAPRVRVQVHPDPLPPLPPAVEVAGYRIAMEAFTNVLHHAAAANCRINLQCEEGGAGAGEAASPSRMGQLQLTITDDGTGMPPTARTGTGLNSMRERAEELGGTFQISSPDSGGTIIEVQIPIDRKRGQG